MEDRSLEEMLALMEDQSPEEICFWTPLQEERAKAVRAVVDDLKGYWPVTVRQIHYRLVEQRPTWFKSSLKNPTPYENTIKHYQDLSRVLKWMRIGKRLKWSVLTDRTRRVSAKRGFEDLHEFIDQELDVFFSGYDRCLVQSQDVYVELWVEKDALSSVFENVAYPFCLRVVTRRGYNSVTAEADYYQRAKGALNKGQTPVVLYFGDFDPSGNDMLRASLNTLQNQMGLRQLETIRVALTKDQIKSYGLPPKPGAAKRTDPRYKDYVKKHGDSAWELDALHPRELGKIARSAIQSVLDMDNFEAEEIQEEKDRERLSQFRERLMDMITREVEGFFN